MKNLIKTAVNRVFLIGFLLVMVNCSKKDNSSDTTTPETGETNTEPVTSNLVHPGLLNTKSQIAVFVAKANTTEEPWKSAYDQLRNSPYSSLTYNHRAYISVDCGSYNKPNIGCDQQVADGMAVYCHSLMYLITKDERYAQKAIEILSDWSNTYQRNTESNSRLVVSWATPWFTNGAEILRYEYPGWTPANTSSFTAMLDKFLPYVTDDAMPGNNWILSSIEAHIAIAVFKDDKTMFDFAINRWKTRVKTYIYQSTDGPKPITVPGKTESQTASIWKDDAPSTSYTDGMGMETCRDMAHLNLGHNSMIYAAEIAWNQKVDLFTLEKKRLSDFMELHGSWMTGAAAVPANICAGKVRVRESDALGVAPPKGGGKSAWDIAYNHLHDRLKIPLPYTLQMLNGARPQSIAKWVNKGETLTHANRTF